MGADERAFAFNQNDAQQLVNLIGGQGGESLTFPSDYARGGRVLHAKTRGNGIPAREGLQMGSEICDLYNCNREGLLEDAQKEITVYNMVSSEVEADTHIVVARNAAGLLVCIVEDCG